MKKLINRKNISLSFGILLAIGMLLFGSSFLELKESISIEGGIQVPDLELININDVFFSLFN